MVKTDKNAQIITKLESHGQLILLFALGTFHRQSMLFLLMVRHVFRVQKSWHMVWLNVRLIYQIRFAYGECKIFQPSRELNRSPFNHESSA